MPVYRLTRDIAFPPTDGAEDGLLAVGGDLSEARLLRAYENGIFPWYSEGEPILWWFPDPRMILVPEDLHIGTRLRRTLLKHPFRITFDTAFSEVLHACAKAPRPDQDGTWITEEMAEAYGNLHEKGYAHSVECWAGEALVGGLYGIGLGACFFGESMFSHQTNASKAALAALVAHCGAWGVELIDCQVESAHLQTLGAREISGAAFRRRLAVAVRREDCRPTWEYEERLLEDYLRKV
jgi:leucyl/phenylalanyl-tRNA--protein transferase